jgi:hypothetical protein
MVTKLLQSMALCVLLLGLSFSGWTQASAQITAETVWELNDAQGNRPAWFTAGSIRGFDIGSFNGEPRIYVPSRGDKVRVLDPANGSEVTLTTDFDISGITGGTIPWNDLEFSDDGYMFIGNLTLGGATEARFKLYIWDQEGGAPLRTVELPTADGHRVGDKFRVLGSVSDNTVEVWATAASTSPGLIYVFTTEDQGVTWNWELITLSGTSTTMPANSAVEPLGLGRNSDFYIAGNGATPRRYNSDGEYISGSGLPGTSGRNGMQYFHHDGKDFLAAYTYLVSGNTNRTGFIRIYDITVADAPHLVVQTPLLGPDVDTFSSTHGKPLVQYDGDGVFTVFALDGVNGFGAYSFNLDRIPLLPPPDDDRLALQPFPFAYNMDTEDVNWFEPTFFPFAGAQLVRIKNPDKSSLNESDYVLEYTKPQGSDAWAGFFYRLDNPVRLTDESVFRLKVWSPKANMEATMKLELVAGGGTPDQKITVTESGQWVELEWDLSELDRETPWDMVTVIMDQDVHPVPTTETWFLDDFRLEGVEIFPVPLAGEYFIPQGGHDRGFESLSEALAALNAVGASDAVTLYIDDDLDETGNTLLISREDLTADTPVLIKPAPGKTPTITVAHGMGGDRTGNTGFSIERAKYVTIDGSNTVDGDSRDLTILFAEAEPAGNSSIMTIYSTVDHITLKNTNLTHIHGEMSRGVLIDRSAGQDSLVQNITLHNVSVGEADQVVTTAVFLNGVFGTAGLVPDQARLMNNITITDSDIYGTRWCIYVQSASNLEFTGNLCTINGYSAVSTQTQRAGIQLQSAENANVSGNNIVFGDINYQSNSAGVGGIYLNRNHGPILISNNFINLSELVNTGSGTGYTIIGIGTFNASVADLDPEYHIYHNTIVLDSPAEEVGKQVAIGPIVQTVSGRFDIRNNIVINRKDAANAYAIENMLTASPNATASFMSDFNNLYVTGDASVGFWGGEARADLEAWQGASGQDLSSTSVAVEFVSNDDLRLAGESLGDFSLAGIPLEAVPVDFFGEPRSETYPYKGAHEGDVELVPDRIAILPPPDDDRWALQPFPFAFNMDTEDVNWFEPTFFPFEGAQLARIKNPDPSGINDSDYVLEYTKPQGAAAWAGFFYRFDNPVQITDESVFKLKVWAPKADFNAVMKLELVAGGGMPDQVAEVTQSGEWVEVEWDLSGVDRETPWDMLTVIMDIDVHPVPTTETWYLDDFRLEGVEIAIPRLAGDYFIPQGEHARGFESLGEALDALNAHGASDAVTFFIDGDLDETGNTLLISRQDLTADTPVLIKPAPEKTPTITVAHGTGGDRTGNTGFSIERAKWVTIDGSNTADGDTRDLTILFAEAEPAGNSSIMTIYSTVNHITVKNTILTHNHGEMSRGVLIDRSADQDSLVQNVTLHNVSIGEAEQVTTTSVFLNGVFGTGLSLEQARLMDNITITDSDIYGTRWCIYVQSASNLEFTGNECVINGYSAVSAQTQRAGIQLQLAENANVSANNIMFGDINYQADASGVGGIFLNRNHGPILISNNFINFAEMVNTGSGTDYAVTGIGSHVAGHADLDPEYHIYHNTILLDSPAEEVGKHVGIGPIAQVVSGRFDIRNNIVVNRKDAANAYAIENFLGASPNATASLMSDFNNLFVTGNASVGFWDGEVRADLDAWASASGQDVNSVSVAVEFESDTDLTLVGSSIGDNRLAGTPIAMVPTDIFGNERSDEYPYMGAFEGEIPLERETSSDVDQPHVFSLDQNYPNPFNPSTNIQFSLPETMEVRLDVYDVTGRHVMTLVNGRRDAGVHTVVFDGAQLASGLYVYRIIAGPHVETRKMTFIK